MKKKLIIILTIFILSIVFITIFIKNNTSIKTKNISTLDKIYNKIDNKEDILIYINENSKTCNFCNSSKNMINYYNDAFKLDLILFNKDKYSNDNFIKLKKKLLIEENSYIVSPAIIIVKKGVAKAIVNEIHDEVDLKNYLVEYNYINKEYLEKDLQIKDEKLEKLYKSDSKNLILIINNNDYNNYKYREKILNLSKNNNFDYKVYIAGTIGSLIGATKLQDEINKNIELPYMLIVQNNKIVDYTTSNNTKKIKEFLNKNGFIK